MWLGLSRYCINYTFLVSTIAFGAILLFNPLHLKAQDATRAQKTYGVNFKFFVKDSCNTSAGVYTKDSILLRTLWKGRRLGPGKQTGYWDGTDDDGSLVEPGDYNICVLSNNVRYVWEGVLGNNSDNKTGSSVFRGYNLINGMAVAGNTAYYSKGYSEGSLSYAKFSTNTPHSKQWLTSKWQVPSLTTTGVATDGVNVYWANIDPADTARSFVFAMAVGADGEKTFANGKPFTTKFGVLFKSTIDLLNNRYGKPTGIAVQEKGSFLLVAHAAVNTIDVLNKNTGELVNTVRMANPGGIAIGRDGNVWVIHDVVNSRVVEKFSVLSDGQLSKAILTLAGILDPLAVAVSPDNNTVVVADGAGSQQLKAFDNLKGNCLWVYGKQGGYSVNPLVTNDKFYFTDRRSFFSRAYSTIICFQPDGSFWVGDPGNARVLHFSTDRRFLDQITYLPVSYSCGVDANNPKRVFSDYLEFEVDYNKPLAPNNGSWKLVKNWGAVVPDSLDANKSRLADICTLKNGRTYALLGSIKKGFCQLAELQAAGPLRLTGVTIAGFPNVGLYRDGSLRITPKAVDGKPAVWLTRKLASFDYANNPIWGTESTLATAPNVSKEAPVYRGLGILRPGEITSTGVLVSFDNGIPPNGSDDYHLGGIKLGSNKWLWKTARVTNATYSGDFPADGSYDVGNGAMYGGGVHLVEGRNIFWGYHGEFWKNSQVNKWNHVWDNGLFVGQFGATGVDDPNEAAVGMAGNAFSASIVRLNDTTYYLYHNDESYHSGLHRWKISGLASINMQVCSITLNARNQGLAMTVFDDTVLDIANVRPATTPFIYTGFTKVGILGEDSQTGGVVSVSLRGFIKAVTSTRYTFYTGQNKGTRLYINKQLLVNNVIRANADSAGVFLIAGRQYPILAEYYNIGVHGRPSILWSSETIAKQPLPLSQLTPTDGNLAIANNIDLMQGLQNYSTVENGLHGWAREPATDDSTNRLNKWWNVRSNIKKFSWWQPPDVYVCWRQAGNGTGQVRRNLGAMPTAVNNWRLYGNISFEKNFPNVGNDANAPGSGGCFFELLDKNEKVLVRFYPIVMHYWDDIRLYANDKLILKTSMDDFKKLFYHANPLDINYNNGQLTLQLGNLPAVALTRFDAGGVLEFPQTMRVFFWSNGNNYDRVIDLEGFFFNRGK